MEDVKKGIVDPLSKEDTPLAFRLNVIAKKYYGAAAKQMENLDMERYFFVLKLIAKSEFITQQCLANCLKVDKAGIVRMIDYLSDKGLVIREVNPNDRREHRILASKKGLKYVTKIEASFNDINQKAFAGFSKSEVKQYIDMCQRINENLESLPSTEYSIIYTKN